MQKLFMDLLDRNLLDLLDKNKKYKLIKCIKLLYSPS